MGKRLDDGWRAHCHEMARAAHAIADRCEDSDMLAAYVALAARWLRLADAAPTAERPRETT
jgi:hypothetical protein